jgi:hypothetical protein
VNAVAFSPDGNRVASVNARLSIKFWDVGSGQEALTLRGFATYVLALAFSADGTRLAAVDGGGNLKLWDTRPWTAEVVAEREAVGLLTCLFAKPLCKADVLDYLRTSGTISPQAREKALALVGRYQEERNPERYYQASRALLRQPNLNRVQYHFALRQAQTACQREPQDARYQAALAVAQYRAGQHQDAAATLERLRQAMKTPEWAGNAEAQGFLREAEALLAGMAPDRKQ